MNLKYEQKDEEDYNNGGNVQVGQMKTRNARNKAYYRMRSRCIRVDITQTMETGKILNGLNSRILPLLGPTLILPKVQMDPSIFLHYYLVGTQILQL